MCDIYVAECKVCGKEIDMHLGDYDTDRDEVEVYCYKHRGIKTEGVLWRVGKGGGGGFKVGDKFWVIPLTENARNNRHHNHPNVGRPEIISECRDCE